ncbi:DUF1292 domain-containing protein [Lottiidibacillus patelloidae]
MTEELDRIYITLPDENDNETTFRELFKFDVDDTGRTYIVLEEVKDEDAEDDADNDVDLVDVVAFRYEEQGEEFILTDIETDEEWEIVEEMLNTVADEEM